MSESSRFPRYLWILSLVAVLAFLIADSVVRMRTIRALTGTHVGSVQPPAVDLTTPSGYLGNQHNVVVPHIGTDGYQWAMQTQQMLAGGGARVRWVDYDGPPAGRAVHWSSFLHWWAAAFAWIDSEANGVPLAQAVERVYPWVNTVCIGILLLALIPVVARRFGAVPASLLAVGSVAVYQVYELYSVGYFDHHGLAASCAMLTVLFLLAGGAGWVKNDSAALERITPEEKALWQWLPAQSQAHRWFIASAVAGGAGLWISAATEIPAMFGVGVATLLGVGALGRGDKHSAWRTEPRLWRTWGMAGAISSMFFFLLEYFPSHMSMRLEVNHPLYALAWFGAGDLLYRLCRTTRSGSDRPGRAPMPDGWWIALDVAMIGLLPAIIVLVPQTFVLRPGSFVMALHEDYIDEFQSLRWQLARWTWTQIMAGIGVLPLLMIGPAIAISAAKNIAKPLRALAITGLCPALAFTLLAFRHVRWLGIGCALWLGTLVAIVTVMTVSRPMVWRWPAARRILAGVALSSIATGFLVRLASMAGPLEKASGAIVILILAAAAVFPTLGVLHRWTSTRLVFAGVFLGLVFLPFPALTLYKWITFDWVYPPTTNDLTEIVTRDVSQKLRSRLGAERGVIASGPTTTTWMIYFGGFKGIGTLYWENIEGLTASANLFGATPSGPQESAADKAYKQIQRLGVTHVVLYSWGPFAVEYARLALGLRPPATPTIADQEALKDAFGPQLVLAKKIPVWLRPIPYQLPPIPGLEDAWLWILEVVPDQTPEEAAVRFAQYYLAVNDQNGALGQLNAALSIHPDYLPALINLARVQHDRPQFGDFRATVQRIRASRASRAGTDSLKLEDNINLASVYSLSGDTVRTREVVARAIAQADEKSVRHLPPDYSVVNFIVLARQLNLASVRPEIINLAFSLLAPNVQAQLQANQGAAPPIAPAR